MRWLGCVEGWRTARSAGHRKVLLRRARSVRRSALLLQAQQSSLCKPGGLTGKQTQMRTLTGQEVWRVAGLQNKVQLRSEGWQYAFLGVQCKRRCLGSCNNCSGLPVTCPFEHATASTSFVDTHGTMSRRSPRMCVPITCYARLERLYSRTCLLGS